MTCGNQRRRRLCGEIERNDGDRPRDVSERAMPTGGSDERSNAQDAKLAGLLCWRGTQRRFQLREERDDPGLFTAGHMKFKKQHNKRSVAPARYCQFIQNDADRDLVAMTMVTALPSTIAWAHVRRLMTCPKSRPPIRRLIHLILPRCKQRVPPAIQGGVSTQPPPLNKTTSPALHTMIRWRHHHI